MFPGVVGVYFIAITPESMSQLSLNSNALKTCNTSTQMSPPPQ